MIEKEDIIEYYTVALSGGVDEESIQELREELYKAIEEDNQSDYTQVLWELLVQVKRQVDFRSEYYQHVNDVNKADILKLSSEIEKVTASYKKINTMFDFIVGDFFEIINWKIV